MGITGNMNKRMSPLSAFGVYALYTAVAGAFFAWGGYQVWDVYRHPELWDTDLEHNPEVMLWTYVGCCALFIFTPVFGALLELIDGRHVRRKAQRKKACDDAVARAEQYGKERKYKEAQAAVEEAQRILGRKR
jgi:hypothetical protein